MVDGKSFFAPAGSKPSAFVCARFLSPLITIGHENFSGLWDTEAVTQVHLPAAPTRPQSDQAIAVPFSTLFDADRNAMFEKRKLRP